MFLIIQANAAGFGSYKDLEQYSAIRLFTMLKYKSAWNEWSRDNDKNSS